MGSPQGTHEFVFEFGAPGITQALTTGGVTQALPVKIDGGLPKYVHIGCDDGMGIRPCYVGNADPRSGAHRIYGAASMIVNVSGYTHIRLYQLANPSTAHLVPLENF